MMLINVRTNIYLPEFLGRSLAPDKQHPSDFRVLEGAKLAGHHIDLKQTEDHVDQHDDRESSSCC